MLRCHAVTHGSFLSKVVAGLLEAIIKIPKIVIFHIILLFDKFIKFISSLLVLVAFFRSVLRQGLPRC